MLRLHIQTVHAHALFSLPVQVPKAVVQESKKHPPMAPHGTMATTLPT